MPCSTERLSITDYWLFFLYLRRLGHYCMADTETSQHAGCGMHLWKWKVPADGADTICWVRVTVQSVLVFDGAWGEKHDGVLLE